MPVERVTTDGGEQVSGYIPEQVTPVDRKIEPLDTTLKSTDKKFFSPGR